MVAFTGHVMRNGQWMTTGHTTTTKVSDTMVRDVSYDAKGR